MIRPLTAVTADSHSSLSSAALLCCSAAVLLCCCAALLLCCSAAVLLCCCALAALLNLCCHVIEGGPLGCRSR